MRELRAGERFFISFEGEEGLLTQEESHHAIRVLRRREGDELKLIDGKGREYRGRILEIIWKKRSPIVRVRILDLLREEQRPSYEIRALIPLLKGDLTEFLIEKGTELGVTQFLLYISDRTVIRSLELKIERFLDKARSALKQSGRLYLPEITPIGDLKAWLTHLEEGDEIRVLAHGSGTDHLESLIEGLSKGKKRVLFAIGPEGDFSEEELNFFDKKGFLFLKLGPNVLRAETAFCVLCGIISLFLWHSTKRPK